MAKSRKKNGPEKAPAEQAPAPQVAKGTAAELDRDRVAARAYEIYQARGGGHGLAMEDWLAAEREAGQEPRGGNDDDR